MCSIATITDISGGGYQGLSFTNIMNSFTMFYIKYYMVLPKATYVKEKTYSYKVNDSTKD